MYIEPKPYKDNESRYILEILKQQSEYLRKLRKLPDNLIDSDMAAILKNIEGFEAYIEKKEYDINNAPMSIMD